MWSLVGVTIYSSWYLDKKQGRKERLWAHFFISNIFYDII
jgi:hypothetical protein